MKEESTHTHYTNEILLGASVSDHPQNFATKEASLSPTHWQTPAFFFARSAPQIEAGARFRHAPQAPNTQTCLLACCCLLPLIIMDWAVSIHLRPKACATPRDPPFHSRSLPPAQKGCTGLNKTSAEERHAKKANLVERSPPHTSAFHSRTRPRLAHPSGASRAYQHPSSLHILTRTHRTRIHLCP
jgi:hypothetical protein